MSCSLVWIHLPWHPPRHAIMLSRSLVASNHFGTCRWVGCASTIKPARNGCNIQYIPIIYSFHMCEFADLLWFTCSPKINPSILTSTAEMGTLLRETHWDWLLHTVNPHFQIPYWWTFLFDVIYLWSKINSHGAFVVTQRHAQSSEKSELLHTHFPSWGWTRWHPALFQFSYCKVSFWVYSVLCFSHFWAFWGWFHWLK